VPYNVSKKLFLKEEREKREKVCVRERAFERVTRVCVCVSECVCACVCPRQAGEVVSSSRSNKTAK